MKKIILPSLLMSGLVLFSFTKSKDGGISEKAKTLEQKMTGLKIAKELPKSFESKYNLSKTQLVSSKTSMKNEDALKDVWIIKTKFSTDIFDKYFVRWTKEQHNEIAQNMINVLEKYSNNGYTKIQDGLYEVSNKARLSSGDASMLRGIVEKEYKLSEEEIKKSNTEEGIEMKEISF